MPAWARAATGSPPASCAHDRRHAPRLPDRRDTARHRHGAEVTDALVPVEDRRRAPRRPRACRRGRSRGRRTRARPRARCGWCSTMHAATCAWWCCTPRVGRSRSSANFDDRYSGWRSWATTSGVHAVERGQVVDGLEERLVGGQVLEVAQVVAGDDVVAAGDRDGALQLAADREHRATRARTGAAAAPARTRAIAGAAATVCRWPAPRSRHSGCGSAGRG